MAEPGINVDHGRLRAVIERITLAGASLIEGAAQRAPAHVYALRRKVRTERNFDDFL